jgi:hypothetical protein
MQTTYHTPIVTENKGKTKAIAKTVVLTQEYPNIRMEIEHWFYVCLPGRFSHPVLKLFLILYHKYFAVSKL